MDGIKFTQMDIRACRPCLTLLFISEITSNIFSCVFQSA